jgi:hypothetical protein
MAASAAVPLRWWWAAALLLVAVGVSRVVANSEGMLLPHSISGLFVFSPAF